MLEAVERLSTENRTAWTCLAFGAGTLAILKGLRLPNLWAATQLQLNYDFGLIKRGAVGALLHYLGIPIEKYWVLSAFSFLILASAIVLFIALVRRKARSPQLIILSAIFASSFATTYFVNDVGYLDLILLVPTLAILAMRWRPTSIAFSWVVCIAGILVHEGFLLTFFPVIWFRFFMVAYTAAGTERKLAIIQAVTLPLVILAETVLISLSPSMNADSIAQMHTAMLAQVDFPLDSEFFRVLNASLADNLHIMAYKYRTAHWWRDEVGASITLLSIAALFTWRSVRIVGSATTPHKTFLQTIIVCVSLSALALQGLGSDLFRWDATAALCAFLVHLLVVEAIPLTAENEQASSIRIGPSAALVIIGLNLSMGAGLFDHYKINTFPYTDQIYDVMHSYKNNGVLLSPPQ